MEVDGRLERFITEVQPLSPREGRKSRFTEADVARMRELRRQGMSQRQIAQLVGTTQAHVGRLLRNPFGRLATPGHEQDFGVAS